MRGLLIPLALALSACGHQADNRTAPASTEASPHQAGVEALVRGEAERQRLIGTQYAVLHEGRWIASGAFGVLDLDTQAPVTEQSEFLIASITKAMTAAAALRLAERGAFDLDARVQSYVPSFPPHAEGEVTPRLLLNHRAGIRHYRRGELGPALFTRRFDTANDALGVFAADAYIAAPNTQESYSSFGYALLAAAMEGATRKTFTQVLQEEVFAPLHLEHASVPNGPLGASYSYFDASTNTVTEAPLRAPVNDYSYNPGGGNVIANARAVAQFGRAFVRPGYLSAASYALITADLPETPVATAPTFVTLSNSRYGWLIGRDMAGRLFLHSTGASEAFQAGVTVYPEQDLVITALTNTWGVNSRQGGFTVPLHVAIAASILD